LTEISKDQLILDSLREGRKQWTDLERELVKSGKMSLDTLSKHLKGLEKDKAVRRVVDTVHRPAVVWYMLTEYGSPFDLAVEQAVKAIRKENRFLKEPTIKEIAARVGDTPENVNPVIYRLAPKIGWREQTVEEAESEARDALEVAAWMRWLERGKPNAELESMANEDIEAASKSVKDKAKRLLKNCPEIVPEAKPSVGGRGAFSTAGLEWPNETFNAWVKVFRSPLHPKHYRSGAYLSPH
jgi:DNA-binding HxlR family transcriptional regulator